jgi:hypothetical protein
MDKRQGTQYAAQVQAKPRNSGGRVEQQENTGGGESSTNEDDEDDSPRSAYGRPGIGTEEPIAQIQNYGNFAEHNSYDT